MNKYKEYELLKQELLITCESQDEYDRLIAEIIERLKI